jgi:AAA+ superfamily predicted ATPase
MSHCVANTSEGQKCSRKVRRGTNYCWQHENQEPAQTSDLIGEEPSRKRSSVLRSNPQDRQYLIDTAPDPVVLYGVADTPELQSLADLAVAEGLVEPLPDFDEIDRMGEQMWDDYMSIPENVEAMRAQEPFPEYIEDPIISAKHELDVQKTFEEARRWLDQYKGMKSRH